MSAWTEVGKLGDIPVRGARIVRTAQGCIAVFRTLDDQVFALDNRCPHKGGPLSEGIVHGHSVSCPLHNLAVDLTSGATADGTVPTYPARIDDGRVFLDVGRSVAPVAK
ncbi:nitrite reductase small subunit NirD [Poseidonocella sp. HB161398]|uniref:nitrite reductase small subunit NirD n=1 Tax=Poseidonocella sp. HB161398 TaxID=2320855 RepID=UPI001109FD46|nr:nitrite reductase small subunit NirD [Poseidonocella sp. HB161398]